MASAINDKCCKYNRYRRGSGVVKFIMKSQTGIQYPVSTQEHCTDCKQEYSTQMVHKNIAQVVSRK